MLLKINNSYLNIKIARNFYEKVKGLMGIKNIDYGLLIPKCNKVHTFKMLDNIDILVLDERNMIMFKYQNMPPNKIVTVEEDINKTSILELPKNTSQNISIGDILTFEDEHII